VRRLPHRLEGCRARGCPSGTPRGSQSPFTDSLEEAMSTAIVTTKPAFLRPAIVAPRAFEAAGVGQG